MSLIWGRVDVVKTRQVLTGWLKPLNFDNQKRLKMAKIKKKGVSHISKRVLRAFNEILMKKGFSFNE